MRVGKNGKWVKNECKKLIIILSRSPHPIKNNNNKVVSSTNEKLKAWNSHYKFLGLDSSGHNLSKDFCKDTDALRNLGRPR